MKEKIDYNEMSWNELVDETIMPMVEKSGDRNKQILVSTLLTVSNELNCMEEVQEIFVKMMKEGYFPRVFNWFEKGMNEF